MPLFSNLPALRLALAYVLHDPSSLLPHATIPTLLDLPVPVSSILPTLPNGRQPNIRALVLDKDNTLCPPKTTKLHQAYVNTVEKLKASPEFSHNDRSIVIVSNTAGVMSRPDYEAEARELEDELGLPVLRQSPERKKPLCGPDVLAYFKKHGVTDTAEEIVFIGDRLATDVLIAREIGAWSIWCKEGWRNPEVPGNDYRGFFSRMEARYENLLRVRFGRTAPLPGS